ncbi:MAG: hypothetical protein L6435_14025 [Anaerolineae bacterium]|nr:hypothetical protein [Anaerolineae bacterium]
MGRVETYEADWTFVGRRYPGVREDDVRLDQHWNNEKEKEEGPLLVQVIQKNGVFSTV